MGTLTPESTIVIMFEIIFHLISTIDVCLSCVSVLLQATETNCSQHTELDRAKRCFAYLQSLGVSIAIVVLDSRRGIVKWIRENCVDTKHCFEIWHKARSTQRNC